MMIEELSEAIQEIIPGASVDCDNYGQIVVYTNKMENDDGEIVDFVDDEGQEFDSTIFDLDYMLEG